MITKKIMITPLFTFFALSLFFSVSSCKDDDPSVDKPDEPNPVNKEMFIKNNYFEEAVTFDGNSSWYFSEGSSTEKGEAAYAKSKGYQYSNCIRLTSKDFTDISVNQKIKGLVPGKLYTLYGKIKTENVLSQNNKYAGASICLGGTWQYSIHITGTKDWTDVARTFTAPASGEITVSCRLGYWDEAAKGTAWFDNLRLVEPTDVLSITNQFLNIHLNKKVVSISEVKLNEWSEKLAGVYLSYVDLMNGKRPFNGEYIHIVSVETIPAWAWAGQSIEWNQDYVSGALLDYNDKGDWIFGILHELGHDFSPGNFNFPSTWIWDEELMANFRMAYILEKQNGQVFMDNKIFQGADIINFYKPKYDETIAMGKPANRDAILYTLLRIKDKYGWDAIKNLFAELYVENPPVKTGKNDWEKFTIFLDALSNHVSADVSETYTQTELALIKEALLSDN